MNQQQTGGLGCPTGCSENTACVHTEKVYDQCRDKDCISDLRVYFTSDAQCVINNAASIKIKKADVIWVYSDIEALPFNRGYYSVDLKYFFRITLEAYTGLITPTTVYGISVFDKKVILYGSEGTTKVFGSHYRAQSIDPQSIMKQNMPHAVVEVVEPIALSARLCDPCTCKCECEPICKIPEEIAALFEGPVIASENDIRVYVTIGEFSVIRLERSTQLLLHSYDFAIPEKECIDASDESDPCELFSRIDFPVNEFFPPACPDKDSSASCGCGK